MTEVVWVAALRFARGSLLLVTLASQLSPQVCVVFQVGGGPQRDKVGIARGRILRQRERRRPLDREEEEDGHATELASHE